MWTSMNEAEKKEQMKPIQTTMQPCQPELLSAFRAGYLLQFILFALVSYFGDLLRLLT